MNARLLDPYRNGRSLVHNLDGRVKFVLALGFILTAALVPTGSWAVYLLLLALVQAAAVLSELGPGYVLKRSLLALPFVLAALPVMFTISGRALMTLPIGSNGFILSEPGLVRFLSISVKSWISVQAAILLAATTPFPDLLVAMRALRIPRLLVTVIGLMWRYLFVMVDAASRMLRARTARSTSTGLPGRKLGGKVSWRARVTGGMAGSLLLRSLERADRIYAAMLSRGYDGEARSLPRPPLTANSWLLIAGGLSLYGFLFFFALILAG